MIIKRARTVVFFLGFLSGAGHGSPDAVVVGTMNKHSSIQTKLLRVIMLVAGTVLFLTCAAFFVYEYITYRDITKRELQILGQVTASNSTRSLGLYDKKEASEMLSALKAQKHVVAAYLFDRQGKIFASYPSTLIPGYLPKVIKRGYHFNGNCIEGFEPVVQDKQVLGTLYLRSDIKAIYDRFILYGIIAITFTALSFLFALLLTKRLQSTISDPILELAEKAKIVSDKKDYSVRAQTQTNDEIGILTNSFNQMLTQIQIQNEEINALNASLEEKIILRTEELQKANATLLKQNEFIQTIIDSSVDVIAVFDRQLNYLVVNRQSEIVYDKKKRELVGKNLLQLYPTLKGSIFVDNIQKAFAGEMVHQGVYKSIASNHYFENFFIPLRNEKNEVDRVLAIAHDISTIMRTNEELRQLNTELEKSNQNLEQFAYVASHDLQEPLRKIQLFSELSIREFDNPDVARQYLEKIQSSANRMSNLIKAVLNYSRLSETGDEFTDVDLNTIINNLKIDLELLIQEKKAIIKSDVLPIVKGIPLQLNQLFLNLFSNSLKFTERPPQITISSSLASSNKLPSDILSKNGTAYAEIIFSDNGIGFDQQYADQVFSIFQRLHVKDKYEGTGIGLALCKKIVENHKGYISVKSQPEIGTSFTIYLPLAHPSDQTINSTTNTIATNFGERS